MIMPVDVFFQVNMEQAWPESGNGDTNKRGLAARIREIFNLTGTVSEDEEESWSTDGPQFFSGR